MTWVMFLSLRAYLKAHNCYVEMASENPHVVEQCQKQIYCFKKVSEESLIHFRNSVWHLSGMQCNRWHNAQMDTRHWNIPFINTTRLNLILAIKRSWVPVEVFHVLKRLCRHIGKKTNNWGGFRDVLNNYIISSWNVRLKKRGPSGYQYCNPVTFRSILSHIQRYGYSDS